MGNFVTWTERDHLQLNVTKTKELIVDLRRVKTPVTAVSTQRVPVDTVEDNKNLGVFFNYELDWTRNTEAVYKKGQSQLFFLRRLRSLKHLLDDAKDVL